MIFKVDYKYRKQISTNKEGAVLIEDVPQYSDVVDEISRLFEGSTFGLKILSDKDFFDFINFSNTSKPLLVIVRGSGIVTDEVIKRLDNLSFRKDLKVVYLSHESIIKIAGLKPAIFIIRVEHN
ncbi:MAG: hypothetical protein D8H99_68680 [Streptococcus sp.]|nr:MAG: hypothetical protein D8H99_68680 [Streptococcus sp.]